MRLEPQYIGSAVNLENITVSPFDPSNAVNATNDTILLGGGHGFVAEQKVIYSRGNDSAGISIRSGTDRLVDGTAYYVILVGSDRVKLATTRQNAEVGVAIDLDEATELNGSHSLTYTGTAVVAGNAMAMDGGTLVVGAQLDGASYGMVLVYDWNGNRWVEQAKLLPSDRAYGGGQGFGYSVDVDWVDVDNRRIVVGAPRTQQSPRMPAPSTCLSLTLTPVPGSKSRRSPTMTARSTTHSELRSESTAT